MTGSVKLKSNQKRDEMKKVVVEGLDLTFIESRQSQIIIIIFSKQCLNLNLSIWSNSISILFQGKGVEIFFNLRILNWHAVLRRSLQLREVNRQEQLALLSTLSSVCVLLSWKGRKNVQCCSWCYAISKPAAADAVEQIVLHTSSQQQSGSCNLECSDYWVFQWASAQVIASWHSKFNCVTILTRTIITWAWKARVLLALCGGSAACMLLACHTSPIDMKPINVWWLPFRAKSHACMTIRLGNPSKTFKTPW